MCVCVCLRLAPCFPSPIYAEQDAYDHLVRPVRVTCDHVSRGIIYCMYGALCSSYIGICEHRVALITRPPPNLSYNPLLGPANGSRWGGMGGDRAAPRWLCPGGVGGCRQESVALFDGGERKTRAPSSVSRFSRQACLRCPRRLIHMSAGSFRLREGLSRPLYLPVPFTVDC